MRRDRHPFEVMAFDALSRQFGIDPAEMRAYIERRRRAPRWLVDAIVSASDPLLNDDDFDVDESLPSVANVVTIATDMEAQTTQGKIRGARPTKNGATDKLRALGVSIAEVATDLDVPYSTARSWFQDGKSGRPAPAKHAASLRRKYGIEPSDLPNGVAGK